MTTSKRRIPINEDVSATEQMSAQPNAADAGVSADSLAVHAKSGESRGTSARSGGQSSARTRVSGQASASARPEDDRPGASVGEDKWTSPEAETNEGQGPAGEPAAGEGVVALEEVIQERDELKDALLRLRAEFDNFRKRVDRDLREADVRAQGRVIAQLLPVLDNLERALDAAEHHEEGKVIAGVRMTRDMFAGLLRDLGVEEIETVGKVFDPHVHEAISTQPSSEEEGTITAVFERGYRLGDRVLRPARVVVSSGPDTGDSGSSE